MINTHGMLHILIIIPMYDEWVCLYEYIPMYDEWVCYMNNYVYVMGIPII